MIYTVTMNPAVDELITVESLRREAVSNVLTVEKVAGGKGINVGRALRTLGVESEQLALLGNDTRDLFRRLMKAENLELTPFFHDGDTRVSRTLVFQEECLNTHLKERGRVTEYVLVKEMKKYLEKKLQQGDVIVLSGSVPEGVDDDVYASMIELARSRDVLTFLDTSGAALEAGINAIPFCLKINLDEFIDFTIQPNEDVAEFKQTAARLFHSGISLIVITMAAEGAVLYDGEQYLYAKIKDERGEFDQRYGVGSGDAFLAGFLAAFIQAREIRQCLSWGVACGSANALQPGSARFAYEDFERLQDQVEIRRET